VDDNVKVAWRTTGRSGFSFATHSEARACIHACRYLYLNLTPVFDSSFTRARPADRTDVFASAAALMTRPADRKEALLVTNLACTIASSASRG